MSRAEEGVKADEGYIYTDTGHNVVLVEATAEGYRERGSFTIPDVELQSWPHPAIIGGMLYLREQDHLFCYDLRAAG